MNPRNVRLLWGVALIVMGLLFTAQNLGFIGEVAPLVWAVFFTGLSLAFFATYFFAGTREWPWLVPAFVFAGLAVTVTLSQMNVDGAFVGAPLLGSVAVPFFIAYYQDRVNRWWALIPAYVMSLLTLVVLLADRIPGEVMGTFVLWGIALPFLFVFLTDRARWWALIPAGVMGVVGLIPLLTLGITGWVIGPVVMFLFAVPFLVTYFWSPKNWWALIPAGIFLSICVLTLLIGERHLEEGQENQYAAFMFLGWALTFLILWLRRGSAPTGWAIYAAGGLALVAVVTGVFGQTYINTLWPVGVILVGAFMLYRAIARRQA